MTNHATKCLTQCARNHGAPASPLIGRRSAIGGLLLALSAFVCGCGGGGDGAPSASIPTVPVITGITPSPIIGSDTPQTILLIFNN